MKSTRLLLAFPMTLLASYVASAAAEYRCNAPAFPHERVACAEAKQGPDALRRYIGRTQYQYNLRFSDFMSQADLDRHYTQTQLAGQEGPPSWEEHEVDTVALRMKE